MRVEVHPAGADTLFRPAFALVCLYSLLTTLASGSLLPVLPLYVRGPLDGGDVAVGIVMSGALLVGALAQPVLGRLAHGPARRGRGLPRAERLDAERRRHR